MSLVDHAKRLLDKLAGRKKRPSPTQLRRLTRRPAARAYRFADDGSAPNNPKLPLVLYRKAVALGDAFDPAAVFEAAFAANGWKDSWRNGIYDYRHFHTGTHEVLGVARGSAMVEFGGARGRRILVQAGDVVVLPAGTVHKRIEASDDLLVVGAYPRNGRYDQETPETADPDKARASIAATPAPARDPIYGADGPLLSLWSGETAAGARKVRKRAPARKGTRVRPKT